MCCFSQKAIGVLGIIFSVAFFIGSIICIIISGVNYKYLDYSFSNFSWNNLGNLELASTLYSIFTSLIGFCSFWSANLCLVVLVRDKRINFFVS